MRNRLAIAVILGPCAIALSACSSVIEATLSAGSASHCGDGICNFGETCSSCPKDCGGCQGTCVPTTCAAQGKNCGTISDGCGGKIDCGTCTAPASCGGGGMANVCGSGATCAPKSCADQAVNCGTVPDGCGGTLDCGGCTIAGQTCGGGGRANVCGSTVVCMPTTCAALSATCGTPSDGCSALLNCGSCASPATCGGGGTPFACGTPPPPPPPGGPLPQGISDFSANANIKSVGSGPWSAGSTWSSGKIPGAGDVVLVDSGTQVTYDVVSDVAVQAVGVRGQLNFRTDISTRLTVGTLEVLPGAQLTVGTASTPVSANVTAEVVIADQAPTDAQQFGTGLIGFGKVSMCGAAKTSFAKIQELAAGASSGGLNNTIPVGWNPGDGLVIPASNHVKGSELSPNLGIPLQTQWEELVLTGVSGQQLTFSPALKFAHPGARDGNGVLDFWPHIMNTTRNVVIRSQNANGQRGHVLFTSRADVDIRYTRFDKLGRSTLATGNVTNDTVQRYPLHLFHLYGPSVPPANGYQFTLIGNSITNSSKWALTVNDSSYGLVQSNVIYNSPGAGIITIFGNESRNVIEKNFIINTVGTGGRMAYGIEGVGIWLRGTNNFVRDNVVADAWSDQPNAAYGFKYFLTYVGANDFTQNKYGLVPMPNFAGGDTTQPGQFTVKEAYTFPILEFARNEVYAAPSGMSYWWVGTQNCDGRAVDDTVGESVIKDLFVWHVFNLGIFHYPSNHVTIDGMVVRGIPEGTACCSVGILGGDYCARNWTIKNVDIQGMVTGISPSLASNGFGSAGTTQLIQNSYLRDYTGIDFHTLITSSYRADWIPPRTVIAQNVQFDAWPNQKLQSIVMSYNPQPTCNLIQHDELDVQNYNNVTGANFRVYYTQQAGSFVVPQTILNSDGTPSLFGAPTAGLTNASFWSQAHKAIGGAVAPCADQTTRPEIAGFVCP